MRQELREELLGSLLGAADGSALAADDGDATGVYAAPEAAVVALIAPTAAVLEVLEYSGARPAEVSATAAYSAAQIATAASAALDVTAESAAEGAGDTLRSDSSAALDVLSSAVAVVPGGEVGAAAVRATDLLGATLVSLAGGGGESSGGVGALGCADDGGGVDGERIGSKSIALGVATAADLRLELPAFQLSATQTTAGAAAGGCGAPVAVHKLFAFDIFAPQRPAADVSADSVPPPAPAGAELATLFTDAPQLLAPPGSVTEAAFQLLSGVSSTTIVSAAAARRQRRRRPRRRRRRRRM